MLNIFKRYKQRRKDELRKTRLVYITTHIINSVWFNNDCGKISYKAAVTASLVIANEMLDHIDKN